MSTRTMGVDGFDTLKPRERARTMVRLALGKRQEGASPASCEDLSAARELAHCAMTRWFAGMEAGPVFSIACAVFEDLGDSVGAARTRALLGLYLSECLANDAEEEAELRLLALECIRRCLDGLTESLRGAVERGPHCDEDFPRGGREDSLPGMPEVAYRIGEECGASMSWGTLENIR